MNARSVISRTILLIFRPYFSVQDSVVPLLCLGYAIDAASTLINNFMDFVSRDNLLAFKIAFSLHNISKSSTKVSFSAISNRYVGFSKILASGPLLKASYPMMSPVERQIMG